jgi:hypothetical protein
MNIHFHLHCMDWLVIHEFKGNLVTTDCLLFSVWILEKKAHKNFSVEW